VKVLLDESVPIQVRRALVGHEVFAPQDVGWKGLENGDLLAAAEGASFDVLVSADKNLRYQQNLTHRRIAIVELWTNHRPTLERNFPVIAAALDDIGPGAYRKVTLP